MVIPSAPVLPAALSVSMYFPGHGRPLASGRASSGQSWYGVLIPSELRRMRLLAAPLDAANLPFAARRENSAPRDSCLRHAVESTEPSWPPVTALYRCSHRYQWRYIFSYPDTVSTQHPRSAGEFPSELATAVLTRPAPLILLAASIFYLCRLATRGTLQIELKNEQHKGLDHGLARGGSNAANARCPWNA